jgi:hypothetical protein
LDRDFSKLDGRLGRLEGPVGDILAGKGHLWDKSRKVEDAWIDAEEQIRVLQERLEHVDKLRLEANGRISLLEAEQKKNEQWVRLIDGRLDGQQGMMAELRRRGGIEGSLMTPEYIHQCKYHGRVLIRPEGSAVPWTVKHCPFCP